MDYNNGKIYCIRNSVNDEIYVGSTTQRLSKRMFLHKKDMKTKGGNLYKEMNRIGVENFYIELIENHPCNSKEELGKKEGEYIRQMGTLNEKVAGRAKEEFKRENLSYVKEQDVERAKKYRENNREKERERARLYYENNKDKVLERTRKYRENNREKEKQRNKNYRERKNNYLNNDNEGSDTTEIRNRRRRSDNINKINNIIVS